MQKRNKLITVTGKRRLRPTCKMGKSRKRPNPHDNWKMSTIGRCGTDDGDSFPYCSDERYTGTSVWSNANYENFDDWESDDGYGNDEFDEHFVNGHTNNGRVFTETSSKLHPDTLNEQGVLR